jgi:exodeoxyribonuclease VII large subunit
LLPAQVQGAGATPSLVAALAQVPALQRAVGLQAVVVARGGGSLEDLWCFNEPDLVRAVSACPVPVVSAVGHETDTTLCDLAADHRAPTPTAAAEILTPNASELLSQLRATLPWLADRSLRRLQDTHQRLDTQQDRLLRPLQQRLQAAHHTLGSGQQQLRHAAFQALRAHVHQLDLTARTIEALDPRQILDRGYTLTYQKGRLLRRQADLDTAMPIQTHWADGQADSQPL